MCYMATGLYAVSTGVHNMTDCRLVMQLDSEAFIDAAYSSGNGSLCYVALESVFAQRLDVMSLGN